MLKNTFNRRFSQLDEDFSKFNYQTSSYDSGRYMHDGEWRKWATSAQTLLLAVFGERSPYYKNFVKQYGDCDGRDYSIDSIYGVFSSAKDDFCNGYVFDVDLRISGEVFGDFVALAKKSLSEGHKDVAAVLACAALEDALKRYASVNGIDSSNKTMQEVVNSLKSTGLVNGAQKTLLDAMPRIRNFAMHADWNKLSEPDINSVIGFVEQFLLTRFSEN